MPAKTIALSHDAYERLLRLKRPGESFSDVVRRITPEHPLTSRFGILSLEEADALEDAITRNRAEQIELQRPSWEAEDAPR